MYLPGTYGVWAMDTVLAHQARQFRGVSTKQEFFSLPYQVPGSLYVAQRRAELAERHKPHKPGTLQ